MPLQPAVRDDGLERTSRFTMDAQREGAAASHYRGCRVRGHFAVGCRFDLALARVQHRRRIVTFKVEPRTERNRCCRAAIHSMPDSVYIDASPAGRGQILRRFCLWPARFARPQ